MDVFIKNLHKKVSSVAGNRLINCLLLVFVIIYLTIICAYTIDIFPFLK